MTNSLLGSIESLSALLNFTETVLLHLATHICSADIVVVVTALFKYRMPCLYFLRYWVLNSLKNHWTLLEVLRDAPQPGQQSQQSHQDNQDTFFNCWFHF